MLVKTEIIVTCRARTACFLPEAMVSGDAPDNKDPTKIERQHGRKWQLSQWMTTTEIVQTCWAAVQRAELHEAAEKFTYNGADIFNTHLSADALVILCKNNSYEHRGEK